MKLKYYLRGLSIGIIVTVIIMMISFAGRKETLTDEEIMLRAKTLGMIMPEEEASGPSDTLSEGENSEDENQEDSNSKEQTLAADVTETPDNSVNEPENEPEIVEITVEKGEFSDKISQKIFENGLIEEADDFNRYLMENGYDIQIAGGAHFIPRGSTYEEIAKILCEKPENQ